MMHDAINKIQEHIITRDLKTMYTGAVMKHIHFFPILIITYNIQKGPTI